MPLWWWQLPMPVGFAVLALKLASPPAAPQGRSDGTEPLQTLPQPASAAGLAVPAPAGPMAAGTVHRRAGCCRRLAARWTNDTDCALLVVALIMLAGRPSLRSWCCVLAAVRHRGLPLASVALSHYQITVNPSLPALPLFTLAWPGLRTHGCSGTAGPGCSRRCFGGGVRGSVVAAAVLCSLFTALTGGSGVTILALGGLLLPLLIKAGYPEQRGIGLVTSASALGVLLAPSVPLIMYAVIARVPIAGDVPGRRSAGHLDGGVPADRWAASCGAT